MKMKFFDFETYPDWWCVVVSDEEDSYLSSSYNYKFTKEEEETIKSKMRVYTSDGGTEEIKRYLLDASKGVLTGYNSKRFDMVIQKCVSMHFTPRQIYIASQIIMEKYNFTGLNVTQTEIARISTYVKGWSAKWQGAEAHQDLMDDSDKGLKDKEASFGMDIRETTVPFGKTNLTKEEKDDIIFYCKHDVYALHVFYACVSKPYVDTKLSLGKTYELPEKICYESTNAVLTGKVLGATRVNGTTIVDPTITIYQKPIREYLEKWVPREAMHHLYTSQKPKQMSMFENKVFMADGGIHSTFTLPKLGKEDGNLYVEADEEYGLYNIDLSGCHPSVMLYVGAMPRGITKPERFESSVLRRRKLKVTPKHLWTHEDKDFVPSGKLIHNTTYGAAGNKYLPLYDDYMRSKVCRVSQMIVIAVCMELYTTIPGLKVIQTNTDGILLYVKRIYKAQIEAIIKNFERVSNFVFELEEDTKIWQLNVNNYIAVGIDNEIKAKGGSFVTTIFQPGYNKVRPLGNYIIAKAQSAYYLHKTNPVKYLLEHTVINDFVLTCTKGSTYRDMIHETENGDVLLGKVARVIAVKNTKYGEVRKRKYEGNTLVGKDLCANCPPHALIINDALHNYVLEGNYTNRRIVNVVTGQSELVDMEYYADLLDRALNIPWYEMKHGQLKFTTEFNLS